ncbi:hypothetical protein BS17DRAFT_779453 [Gyrodon lividus]|nr:hypothetical protein BS17DRAFT_779453 [Gyrodon lividus]
MGTSYIKSWYAGARAYNKSKQKYCEETQPHPFGMDSQKTRRVLDTAYKQHHRKVPCSLELTSSFAAPPRTPAPRRPDHPDTLRSNLPPAVSASPAGHSRARCWYRA